MLAAATLIARSGAEQMMPETVHDQAARACPRLLYGDVESKWKHFNIFYFPWIVPFQKQRKTRDSSVMKCDAGEG
jgi:hypothetical protein